MAAHITPQMQFLRAVLAGRTEVVSGLLTANPDIDVNEPFQRQPPLYMATKGGYDEIVELLLADPRTEVNKPFSDMGWTPLHSAVMIHRKRLTALLLNNGANVHAIDKKGQTPLHYVADPEIVDLLLAHDADINARDSKGDTPLHIAAKGGLVGMVEALINKGADTTVKNNDGKTPREVSKGRVVKYWDMHNATRTRGRNLSGLKFAYSRGVATKSATGIKNLPPPLIRKVGSYLTGYEGPLAVQRWDLRSNIGLPDNVTHDFTLRPPASSSNSFLTALAPRPSGIRYTSRRRHHGRRRKTHRRRI